VPELEMPLERHMLVTKASWENRAQMTRTSARDNIEAVLLYVHHSQYLQAHPHVAIKDTLLQDQLLADAEETLRRFDAPTLDRLRREARALNLEDSRGRIKSDWIEPERLFWAAWHALPAGEKACIAQEAIAAFIERVENAASMDPRSDRDDPMEWHRHRIHLELWEALIAAPEAVTHKGVQRELETWQAGRQKYLARRPVWSQDEDDIAPWLRR
jgi:hypothetical protein